MRISCDLLITGGLVVDGTGAAPFLADVAITGSTIVAVGPGLSRGASSYAARRTVDATGHIVTPGFVDVHTHYDGQITWDPLLSPSTSHGVTTVLFGNCGVGFAPCRAGDREKLIEILEGVEDIPGSALHEGIQWSWETFEEYCETLSRREAACDFLAMVGHVPLRVYAMGRDRAWNKEATPADLAKMRGLVAAAVEAGACGVSTSRTLLHRDLGGAVIPGTYAGRRELATLMCGVADAGGGLFEILDDTADVDVWTEWVGSLSRATQVPVSFAFATNDAKKRDALCAFMTEINTAENSRVYSSPPFSFPSPSFASPSRRAAPPRAARLPLCPAAAADLPYSTPDDTAVVCSAYAGMAVRGWVCP